MKKTAVLCIICLLLSSLFLPVKAEEDCVDIPFEFTFHQDKARATLSEVNAFRTGSDAWYKSQDGGRVDVTGLQELVYDYDLEKAAMVRAMEYAVNSDFDRSDIRPNNKYYYTVYDDLGLQYSYGVENRIWVREEKIDRVVEEARSDDDSYSGQRERRNMLDSGVTAYGCAMIEDGTEIYVVQLFHSKTFNTEPAEAKIGPSIETVSIHHDRILNWSVSYKNGYMEDMLIEDPGKTLALPEGVYFRFMYKFSEGHPLGSMSRVTALQPVWTSDSDIVSIDNGVITGLRPGNAKITAIAPDGSSVDEKVTVKTKEVVRLAGRSRYDTSLMTADALKKELGVEKFDCIVLATGKEFADALGGSFLAIRKKAPIILTAEGQQGKVNRYIRENLSEDGLIYILGGTGAVPESCLEGLEGFKQKRLAGKNRYDTNLLILEEGGDPGDEIIVCTGRNFADSLSAGATGRAILLVGGGFNDAQRNFMNANNGKYFYIAGGTAAIDENLENDIRNYGQVQRVSGHDRYYTGDALFNAFFKPYGRHGWLYYYTPVKAVLVYGDNFPDGLCAGPLAYYSTAPILLVKQGHEYPAYHCCDPNISGGYVLGGKTLIPSTSVAEIFQLDPNGDY